MGGKEFSEIRMRWDYWSEIKCFSRLVGRLSDLLAGELVGLRDRLTANPSG